MRFFFHPGTAEDFATNALAIGVTGHTVRLSFSGGDSLEVSLADKRWQTVEIPFAGLGIEIIDPPPELQAVLIPGNLQGTAYITDLSLVTHPTAHNRRARTPRSLAPREHRTRAGLPQPLQRPDHHLLRLSRPCADRTQPLQFTRPKNRDSGNRGTVGGFILFCLGRS